MVAFGVHYSDTSTQNILMHGYGDDWRRGQLDSKKTQDEKHKSTRNPPEIIRNPLFLTLNQKKKRTPEINQKSSTINDLENAPGHVWRFPKASEVTRDDI